MAFALVQSTKASSSLAATSRAVAYPSNLTTGNLLVLALYWESGTATVSSITDSLGHTWTAIGTLQTNGNNRRGQLYYVKNNAAGANTVTVTYSVAVTNGIQMYEYSGLDPAAPLRGHAETFGTSANPSSGALDVAPVSGDLLFGYVIDNLSPTQGAGYTLEEGNSGWNDQAYGEDKSAAGETSIDWIRGASTWSAFGAAFVTVSGGGSQARLTMMGAGS